MQDIHNLASDTIKVVLVGNKTDLTERRQVSYAQGKALADEYGIGFFEASAKSAANVEEAFMTMASQIRATHRMSCVSNNYEPVSSSGGIVITSAKPLSNGGCCY